MGEYLRDVIADFQFTIRTAAKTPGLTLMVILTRALGIGATTTIFSVVNGVLLEPLPYEDPDELVIMYEHWSSFGTVTVAYPNFVDWHEMNTSFEDLEDASWMEVVGVVGNVKNNGIANDSLVQMFIPFESDQDNTWSLAVRTEGDPLLFVEPIRAAVSVRCRSRRHAAAGPPRRARRPPDRLTIRIRSKASNYQELQEVFDRG